MGHHQRRGLVLLFLCIVLGALSGCSMGKGKALEPGTKLPRLIGFLPVEAPSDIRRERVRYLEDALRAELEASGVSLVPKTFMKEACTPAGCEPGLKKLGAEGQLFLKLLSASKTNFLAGYYNSIKGELTLRTNEGEVLFSIPHSDSERGGILFNTGQVIDALRSTARNVGDDAFNKLADRFISGLVQKVPTELLKTPEASPRETKKGMPTVRARAGELEVCMKGDPAETETLVLGTRTFPLRATASGKRCGVYPRELLRRYENAFIETRSISGEVSRVTLKFPWKRGCSPQGKLTVQPSSKGTTLHLQCKDKEACISACEGGRVEVFHAPDPTGPFRRVGEATKDQWMGSEKGQFAVVLKDEQGILGAPVYGEAEGK